MTPDWQADVHPVSFDDLEPLTKLARKERLSFKATNNTQWFGAYIDGELVGCGGVIWVDKARTTARLKSALVLPEWRGVGVGRSLMERRVEWAIENSAVRMEVITAFPHFFDGIGWTHTDGKPEAHYHWNLT